MISRFDDGNMSDVYRIGDVVRKDRGPWWSATNQVLNHLEAVNFPWAPRVVVENAVTVELSYLDGHSIPASLDGHTEESFLQTIGSCARQLHDALEGFHLRPDTTTVRWPVAPPAERILCHNDLSPWNTIIDGESFKGFIDWDLVSYGTREWELAWMCWRWAPLYPAPERTDFSIHEQIKRCNILLDAYGRDRLDLQGFVDLIDRRMLCALEVVEQLGAQGVPGFDRLLATGAHLSGHDDRAWLQTHRSELTARLDPL